MEKLWWCSLPLRLLWLMRLPNAQAVLLTALLMWRKYMLLLRPTEPYLMPVLGLLLRKCQRRD